MKNSNDELPLSKREKEVADLYAGGSSYREIANSLGISPATVRTHLTTIYRKLNVTSKIGLYNALYEGGSNGSARSDTASLLSELALQLEEALLREQALGEILRIISRSDRHYSEVIEAVLSYTLDLCDADFGVMFEHKDGLGYRASHLQNSPEAFQKWLEEQGWFSVSAKNGLGRIKITRNIVNVPDVRAEQAYRTGDPLRVATADLGRARSFVAIPLLDKEELIGALTVYRQRVDPFETRSLQLAEMFADQSAIAIKNVRLISRLTGSDDLTE